MNVLSVIARSLQNIDAKLGSGDVTITPGTNPYPTPTPTPTPTPSSDIYHVPLPSEMSNSKSAYYESGDCIYLVADKGDGYCTPAFIAVGSGLNAKLIKTLNGVKVSEKELTAPASGAVTTVPLYSTDSDWNKWDTAIVKLTGTIDAFSLQAKPAIKTGAYLTDAFSSCITEVYGKCASCDAQVSTRSASVVALNLLRVFAFSGMSNTSAADMFYGCSGLVSVPELSAPNLTSATSMFENCSSLTKAPNLDLAKATTISSMFRGCKALRYAKVVANAATTISYMFYGCVSLVEAEVQNAACTNVSSAFSGCSTLNKARLSYYNISSTTNGASIFSSCYNLKNVTFNAVGNMAVATNAFTGCYHILGTKNASYNPSGLADGYIYVPASVVADMKEASNWVTWSNQIKAK